MSSFGLSGLLTSFVFSLRKEAFNRRNLLKMAYLLLVIATFSFIFIANVDESHYYIFLGVSIFLRVLQGIGSTFIQIAAFSFVSNEMTYVKNRYIGYLEIF